MWKARIVVGDQVGHGVLAAAGKQSPERVLNGGHGSGTGEDKRHGPPHRSDCLPARDIWMGATPEGRGRACGNAHGPAPVAGPRPEGSLPSTSVLPSAAPATGWRRTQLQATARDR